MGLIKRKRDKKRLKIGLFNVKKEPLNERKVEEENYFYPDLIFKILLIGHNDSGKITHLESYGNAWFESNTKLTIGISFEIKEIKIENLNIKLQIWDLATEDHWRDLVPYYSRGALGAILMFEISNSETLDKLSYWVQTVRDNTTNIPMILMGNYDDLDDPRQVLKEESLEFVRSKELNGYFECNVLTGENLENAFKNLTRMIIEKYENRD